jgi:hypothetical protein
VKRPDLSFKYTDEKGQQTWEIVEITVAWDTLTRGNVNMLKHAYDYKEGKYAQLCGEVRTLTGVTARQTTVVVSSLGTMFKESKTALTKLLRTRNSERMTKYFRKITKAALAGSLDLWRRHNMHNAAMGNDNELSELCLSADEALYMEEDDDPVTQEELRSGVNLMVELFGESDIAKEDTVEITMVCKGRYPIKTHINRNATDDMLSTRAQAEWHAMYIHVANRSVFQLKRPIRAGTTVTFEEQD